MIKLRRNTDAGVKAVKKLILKQWPQHKREALRKEQERQAESGSASICARAGAARQLCSDDQRLVNWKGVPLCANAAQREKKRQAHLDLARQIEREREIHQRAFDAQQLTPEQQATCILEASERAYELSQRHAKAFRTGQGPKGCTPLGAEAFTDDMLSQQDRDDLLFIAQRWPPLWQHVRVQLAIRGALGDLVCPGPVSNVLDSDALLRRFMVVACGSWTVALDALLGSKLFSVSRRNYDCVLSQYVDPKTNKVVVDPRELLIFDEHLWLPTIADTPIAGCPTVDAGMPDARKVFDKLPAQINALVRSAAMDMRDDILRLRQRASVSLPVCMTARCDASAREPVQDRAVLVCTLTRCAVVRDRRARPLPWR